MLNEKYLKFNYEEIINIPKKESFTSIFVHYFIKEIEKVLQKLNVKQLAYSGGIDSTILLNCMCNVFNKRDIVTYSIGSRWDHPDIIHSIIGTNHFDVEQRLLITKTIDKEGDNAVKKLFEFINHNELICGDGIDELMCGYYSHQKDFDNNYIYHLSRLKEDHLLPLNNNSGEVNVYLPYLEQSIIKMCAEVPLSQKVDSLIRKKLMIATAKQLNIPPSIINRRKYGFCSALL